MNWTKEQQQVIEYRHGNLLVSAAAGSGKTAVLVERIIQMVFDSDSPIDIDKLLVVTFTKAAASQMKDKIAGAIEKKMLEDPGNEHYLRQLNLVREANILTIDSFCYKVLKEYFHVISVDPKITIAEEAELELIKQEVLSEVLEDYYKNDQAFVDFSNAYSNDKDDANIEEYMLMLYDISESYPFPEEWLNNAKLSFCIKDEKDLLELPYMKSYINEIRSDAKDIYDDINACLELIRGKGGPTHYEKAVLSDIEMVSDIISERTYSGLHEAASRKFATLNRAPKGSEFDADIADRIKDVRDGYKKRINSLLKPFTVPVDVLLTQSKQQEQMMSAFVDAVIEFSRRFFDRKLSKSLVGFSDVEHLALKILCDGIDDNGMPVPSRVGKELSEKFEEILIDEYQDSNYLQENILRCVSKVPYGCNNIFMVGDVKQSIYGFRMARPDLFTEKYETYDEYIEDAEKLSDKDETKRCNKILLSRNFRSRNNILEAVNYLFYQIMSKPLGGIDYGEKEALICGSEYPVYEKDNVELLIGESKEADMLMSLEEQDDEHLDDEYIDVSGMELEAGMVADRIRKLVGKDGGDAHLITDAVTGKLRPVEYRDIVILFRAPGRYQPVFSEILMKQNIPVKLQNENGYFDVVEILGLITFLKMIDNPYNDVECAAYFRGFFCGFTNDELAVIYLMKRELEQNIKEQFYLYKAAGMLTADKEYFYSIFSKVFAKKTDGDAGNTGGVLPDFLYNKCSKALALLDDYRRYKNRYSISELINRVYYETGYYYYVEAMPEGKERSRNLLLFEDEAKRYEQRGFTTLFGFLRFVKRIAEKNISLGGDASVEITENVVRIMSIHRSKGLEFPVVFVSGLGKQFNLTDTKSPIIIHSDYYISAKYVDPIRRCGNDTFSRKAFASLIRNENIGEELRIFYVALTRAKEKLILTGVTPDITKVVRKMSKVCDAAGRSIKPSLLKNSDSYLDFVVAGMMRNRIFHEAMNNVRSRYNKKGEIVSCRYDVIDHIDTPEFEFMVDIFYYNDMVLNQIDTGEEQFEQRQNRLQSFYEADTKKYDRISAALLWEYEDELLTKQKSKMSVTEIKRVFQNKAAEAEDNTLENTMEYTLSDKQYKDIKPRFIEERKTMDAAEKGTWIHKAMELLDNRKMVDKDGVERELERLYQEERLPVETKAFITTDKIISFAESRLGRRMTKAAEEKRLYKERRFVIGADVIKAAPKVVVQGIIDAYFEEDGKLILIDYKTDRIKTGEEELLKERYKTQLDYYKNTLEKLTGMVVSEVYIYSFALDKEIKL